LEFEAGGYEKMENFFENNPQEGLTSDKEIYVFSFPVSIQFCLRGFQRISFPSKYGRRG